MDIFFSTSMVLRSEAFTRKGAPLLINQNQKSNGHKHKRSIIIFSKLYPFQRHLTRDHYIIFFYFTGSQNKPASAQTQKKKNSQFARKSTITALHQSKNIAQHSCHNSTQLRHSSTYNTTTTQNEKLF